MPLHQLSHIVQFEYSMALNNFYSQRELDNEGYEMKASNYPNPGATNPLGPENESV